MVKWVMSTDYFDVYEVAQYTYAAIKTNDLCMSNAGFINLGDRIVVFDTFLSIEAAKALKETIITMTGQKEFVIVNSHSHVDHFLGNCAFQKGTTIIASEGTYKNILAYKDDIKFGEDHYSEDIEKAQEKMVTLEDAEERLDIENSLIIYRNLSHNEGAFIAPNMTFSNNLTLRGDLSAIDLVSINKAHSLGDTIGIIRDGKVAFVGDLIFNGEHPYLGQGDPYLLIEALQNLLDANIDYFIPGHGPACTKQTIKEQIDYIHSIIALVKDHLHTGEEIKRDDMPKEFHHYRGPAFGWNVSFLSEYLKEVKR